MESNDPNRDWKSAHGDWHFFGHGWFRANLDYLDAGSPFGPSKRAFEIWVECRQQTTVN